MVWCFIVIILVIVLIVYSAVVSNEPTEDYCRTCAYRNRTLNEDACRNCINYNHYMKK